MSSNQSSPTREFTYRQSDYITWVNDFAASFGYQAKDNTLQFAAADGQGNCSAYVLEQGFTACISNFKMNEDFLFIRQPSPDFSIIIYLYYFEDVAEIQYRLENIPVNLVHGSHYTLRMINSQTEQQINITRASAIRGISISLEMDWIVKNLSRHLIDVFNYLKDVNYFKEFINAKQQRLISEILNVPINHPYKDMYIRSRILRIVDKLLENLLQRDITESPEKMSEEDFMTMQKIETILTHSYDKSFPGIEKLSRISLMSESKLKKIFKESFGMGLHEYFQKNRMHRAKEHILSRKFTISQVGTKLGYQNLSNFSTAFRKEFNCLPSELDVSK